MRQAGERRRSGAWHISLWFNIMERFTMNGNTEDTANRIRELERRMHELEEEMRSQAARLEEEMKARGWK